MFDKPQSAVVDALPVLTDHRAIADHRRVRLEDPRP
jgi:hypothetical protein